ncbi:MAG: NAD(P)H-hydrate epimerase [Planctomycetia bacterium]
MRPLARAEVRGIDRRATEEFGLPGIVLMENAGRNAAALLHALAAAGPVAIACGKGNNAGDGFVMARHLENLGVEVRLLLACDPAGFVGDAAINHHVAVHARMRVERFDDADRADWERGLAGATWLVDALLGTGAVGPPRGTIATAIAAINALRTRDGVGVFAVDLPSGLDGDTGRPPGDCIVADVTGTFVARKIGFDQPGADHYTGTVHVLDIGVPRALLRST